MADSVSVSALLAYCIFDRKLIVQNFRICTVIKFDECLLWNSMEFPVFHMWPNGELIFTFSCKQCSIIFFLFCRTILILFSFLHKTLASLGGSVGYTSNWWSGGCRFHPANILSWRLHDHEIFSTIMLSLPLIQEGQLSVSGERMRKILVNRLETYNACPIIVWLGTLLRSTWPHWVDLAIQPQQTCDVGTLTTW